MSFLNKFSKDTQEVARLARQIAEDNRQTYIGSTHFFMGILTQRDSFACSILENMGFDTTELYNEMKKILIPEPEATIPDALVFTPEVKSIFEVAEQEMEKTNWDYIEPVHVLMGLLKFKDSEIKETLKGSGITYKEVMREYKEAIKEGEESLEEADELFGAVQDGMARNNSSRRGGSTATRRRKKADVLALDTFGRNLTALAREGKLDPVVGRDTEIERVWRILARRKKNNVALIGEPGVGKTAIAEGLANYIAQEKAPSKLSNKEIYLLDVSGMVAGSKYRGDFEKKIKAVIDECRELGNIVLFIDEVHTIIGAGGAEGSMDGANILKPALASGELQVIGATTTEEYQKNFEKDSALVRRFQKLVVEQPDKEHTIEILKGLRKYYEDYHGVKYGNDIIDLIVELSDKFITGQFEPDRSINTLDEVGSKLALMDEDNKEVSHLKKKLKSIDLFIEEMVSMQEYEKAGDYKKQKDSLITEIDQLMLESKVVRDVTEEDVREVFSLISGVPVESVNSSSDDAKRYLHMAEDLNQQVIHQEEAIEVISKAIKRKKAGIEDSTKPTVLMFTGPTGTGKTFTAKKLANFLFGDEKKLIFLNGAEYSDKTGANRLKGSDPGYVGYGEATDFEQVRNNPYSVLLVDECEKMHKDVWHTFLSIFEEGELKTANGKHINFKNTVIILTSNIGSELSKKKSMGFDLGADEDKKQERKDKFMKAVKDYFKPEVFNRISKIVVFNDLERDDLRRIVSNELQPMKDALKEKGIRLTVTKKASDHLIDHSDDKDGNLGARPLKRSIENHLSDDIADIVLEKGEDIKSISVNATKEGLKITTK